jgi:hypothetical protein
MLLTRLIRRVFWGLLLTVLEIDLLNCAPAQAKALEEVHAGVWSADSSVFGVFEGITACSEVTKPLPQITSPCEQMIWKLTLNQDPDKLTPTTYELHSTYGLPKQGTPGLSEGAKSIDMAGRWAIVKGAKTDPNAVVYQLNPDSQQAAVYFLKLDENIIHVLDRDLSMMVGNAAWSFTLNRTDRAAAKQVPSQPRHPVFQVATALTKPTGSPMLGVFDGRVPCHEIALEFAGIPAEPDCVKIKWRLTLYQDPDTGAPTTYKLLGTRTTREGTWAVVRGTKVDPEAIVYKLDLGGAQAAVYFLKADENHLMLLDREGNLLVGDALWSYTLSRGDGTF